MWMWILLILAILPMPWVAQLVWPHRVKFAEIATIAAISAALTLVVYGVGRYAAMADIEMLNGQVLNKEREHDRYEQSYSCRCKQVCTKTNGHQSCYEKCDTCYETHYTVKWYVETSLHPITIDSRDSTSRRVYNEPDPARYTEIKKGDPVTISHRYINYVKAAPDSLFHASSSAIGTFGSKIPAYPSGIYDIYKLDRVLSVGVPIPDLREWNAAVSKYLSVVGITKQANLIILFVNEDNSNYIHALAGSWVGGKKNDIVVVVGSTEYPTISWVRILAWTDNEEFKVRMVHELEELKTIDLPRFMDVVKRNVDTYYKRKPMADYEYLEYSFDPPWWVVVLALLVGILSAGGITYWFYVEDTRITNSMRRFRK